MVDQPSHSAMCISKPEGAGKSRAVSFIVTSYWFLDIIQGLSYLNYVEFAMTNATIWNLLDFSHMKLFRI